MNNFPPNMMMGHAMAGQGMQQGQPMPARQPVNGTSQLLTFYQNQQAQLQQQGGGWRAEVPPAERIGFVSELLTALRLARPGNPETATFKTCVNGEQEKFTTSTNKASYLEAKRQLLTQMASQREQNSRSMQFGQMPNQQQGAMQAQMMRQSMSNQGNVPQNFNPQLQRPMQASPIPMNGQMNMGASGMTAPQMQQQQSGQRPQPAQQQQPPQQARMQNTPQQQQPLQLPPQVAQMINQRAQSMLQVATQQQLEIANQWFLSLLPERQQLVKSQGINTALPFFQDQCRKQYIRSMQERARQQQNAGLIQGQNPMMQQALLNNQQRASAVAPGQEFDFAQFLGQQAEGIQSQNAGQTVVPASNNAGLSQQLGNIPMVMAQPNQIQGQGQQMPNGGIGQRPQGFLNNQQANSMQAHVSRAQNAQLQAQMNQNRPQAMNMAGQMVSQQSPMPLLTQPVGQAGQMQAGVQQRPQAAPQMAHHANAMNQMGMQSIQPPQNRPQNIGGPQLNMIMMNRQRQIPAQFAGQLPKELHDKLMTMSEDDFQKNLERLKMMKSGQPPTPQNAQQMGAMPGQFGLPRTQQPSQNAPNVQQMPVGMLSQNQLQQMPPQQRAMMQQRLAGNQGSPELMKSLDQKEFPPSFLQANRIGAVPQHVRTWAQLKEWVATNPNANAITPENIARHQLNTWTRQQQGGRPTPNGMATPGIGGMAQGVRAMPGGQQPQMNVGMSGMMRGLPNLQHIPVSMDEINRLRQQHQGAPGKSDEDLRNHIAANKYKVFQQQQQKGQMPPQSGNTVMQQQPGPAVAGRPQPLQQQQMQQQQMQQQQLQHPGQGTGQVPQNVQQQHGVSRTPQQAALMNMPQQKSLKRPSNDNIAETAQVRPMASTKAQQRPAGPAQQQPRQAQPGIQGASGTNGSGAQASQNAQVAQQARLSALLQETQASIQTQPIPNVTAEQKQQYRDMIKKNSQLFDIIDSAIKYMFVEHLNEAETRQQLRDRILLSRQVSFKDHALNEPIVLDLATFSDTLQRTKQICLQYVTAARQQQEQNKQAQAQQPSTAQDNATPSKAAKATGQVSKPVSGNSAGTQSQRRTSSKPPAAPTSERGQMPFPFPSGIPSPQGVPKYFEAKVPEIAMPPQKRVKRNDGAGGTSPTAPSPQVGKPASPAVKRQPAEVKAEQAPPRPFRCEEPDSEHGARGFETRDQLERHKKQTHFQDPLSFAIESAAEAMGIKDPDLFGKTKLTEKVAGPGTKLRPAGTKGAKSAQKAMTPPATSQAMTRAPTQSGIKTSPAISGLKTPQQQKMPAPTSAPKADVKPETESAFKLDDSDRWKNATIRPSELQDIFKPIEQATGDWLLRNLDSSPSALTPSSSRDSSSSGSRESDILEGDNLNVAIAIDPADANLEDGGMMFLAEHWQLDTTSATDLGSEFLNDIDSLIVSGDGAAVDGAIPGSGKLFSDLFTTDDDGVEMLDLMDWDGAFGPNAGLSDDGGSGIPGWDGWDKDNELTMFL